MSPVSQSTVARHLRELDRSELAAFVADLWAARGWETTVADGVVTAVADGESRRIAVVPGRRFPRVRRPSLPDCDVVVAGDDDSRVAAAASAVGAEYTPPADVRDLLLYGLDREVAAECYREHVGESLLVDDGAARGTQAVTPDGDGAGNDAGPVGDATAGLPSGTTLGALALLLLVAGGVVAGGPTLFGRDREAAAVPTMTYTPAGTEGVYTPVGAEATPTPTPRYPGYPAGLSPHGVVNASKLADAHRDAVSGQSYRLAVKVEAPAGTPGFDDLTHADWEVAFRSPANYRYDLESSVDDRPASLERGYAVDGTIYTLTRVDGDTSYSRGSARSDRTPASIRRFVRDAIATYLGGNGSRLAPATDSEVARYHVIVDGAPPDVDGEVLSYRAEAWLTDDGRILAFRVGYAIRLDGNVRQVRLTFGYDDVGNTTVAEPAWYDEARNATA